MSIMTGTTNNLKNLESEWAITHYKWCPHPLTLEGFERMLSYYINYGGY
jgi:hypothetical protein